MDARTRGRSLAFLQGAGDGAGELETLEPHGELELYCAHRLELE